jgi:hypothetical protein
VAVARPFEFACRGAGFGGFAAGHSLQLGCFCRRPASLGCRHCYSLGHVPAAAAAAGCCVLQRRHGVGGASRFGVGVAPRLERFGRFCRFALRVRLGPRLQRALQLHRVELFEA